MQSNKSYSVFSLCESDTKPPGQGQATEPRRSGRASQIKSPSVRLSAAGLLDKRIDGLKTKIGAEVN